MRAHIAHFEPCALIEGEWNFPSDLCSFGTTNVVPKLPHCILSVGANVLGSSQVRRLHFLLDQMPEYTVSVFVKVSTSLWLSAYGLRLEY